MEIYGTRWKYMELYGTITRYIVSIYQLYSIWYMVENVSIYQLWNCTELYGTIWNYMELYGTIWNLVSTIDIPVYMELIWTIYGTYKCRS